jgi:branched-chain amino acid transport system permease protein
MTRERLLGLAPRWGAATVVLVVLALGPLIFSDFFLSALLTKALWLGIAAASLIFLAGYGGMVSLAQTGLYGVAGFTMANLVTSDGGATLTWDPWAGVVVGIVAAVALGIILGTVASRTEGIYFLMLTLAFGVITFYFFGQVNELSGFGGLNDVKAPGIVSNPVKDPDNLFYIALIASVAVYGLIRYVVRTPFGIVLQGIRDDPTRMRALGYNVTLHRALAFAFGAFIASIAGILSVWWNTRISPGSIDLSRILDVLVIAVVGGLFRLEGAWLGAVVFVLLENYTRDWTNQRFNTLIGVVFLVVVLLSPGGLIGIIERINTVIRGRFGGGGMSRPPEPSPQESSA